MTSLPRKFTFWFVGLCLLVMPTLAMGQILQEDKDAYVRKGFFFAVEYGAILNVVAAGPLSVQGGPQSAFVGHLGGISLGFDLAKQFNLHISYLTPMVPGDTQQGGGTSTHVFSLGAQIHFVRAGQLFVYGKLGGGVVLTFPENAGVPLGVMAHAGLGLLYYTRMRHLAIGIEALGLIRIPIDRVGLTVGVGVMPVLHYTF